MPRIAVTGHMNITDLTADLVAVELRSHFGRLAAEELVGISCLAPGADTRFAEAVLGQGGLLEAIVPARDYRDAALMPEHAAVFDALLARAARVYTMPFEHASVEAYVAANSFMLDRAEQLTAIWDGRPSPDGGGTAAVVEDAMRRQLPVTVIWPRGATRS